MLSSVEILHNFSIDEKSWEKVKKKLKIVEKVESCCKYQKIFAKC